MIKKRIMDLSKVIQVLDSDECDYLFDFIGAGYDRPVLSSMVERMQKVKVLDGISQPGMAALYANYDVLALASEAEGMSISMLEGMAKGLVPIVTRVSGSEEVIVDRYNGFLCEIGDVKSMARRICQLGSNRDLLASMSGRAYETVNKEYSTRLHVKRFSDFIRATLEKPMVSAKDALSCLDNDSRPTALAERGNVEAQQALREDY
jgi:glycosyltransferase involved in cell wall biosynthesis